MNWVKMFTCVLYYINDSSCFLLLGCTTIHTLKTATLMYGVVGVIWKRVFNIEFWMDWDLTGCWGPYSTSSHGHSALTWRVM